MNFASGLRRRCAGSNSFVLLHISVWGEYLSLRGMDITLPQMLEQAWSRALPGREAASQNELLRQLRELAASP